MSKQVEKSAVKSAKPVASKPEKKKRAKSTVKRPVFLAAHLYAFANGLTNTESAERLGITYGSYYQRYQEVNKILADPENKEDLKELPKLVTKRKGRAKNDPSKTASFVAGLLAELKEKE